MTLKAPNDTYPSAAWERAYTDGSAEDAVRNGADGGFVKLPDGGAISRSVATGVQSSL